MIGASGRVLGGRRARAVGIAAVLVLGVMLAIPAGAPLAVGVLQAAREAYLREVADEADVAFVAVETELEAGLDAARRGAALILDGDQSPQEPLEEAADVLEAAGPDATEAIAAAARLQGTLASVRPDAGLTIPELPTAGDLASIAAQLRAAGDAAAPFLLRRHAAEETLAQLERALAALDAGDLDTALEALDAAAEARSALVDWEDPPATLELWLRTTGDMIAAAREIIDATEAQDSVAARRAAEAYAAAANEAQRADVALALSLSETADGLTRTPMRRLANALAAVQGARGVVVLVRG